jgi:CPA1 family monovalent cation:H+ antiporter
MPSLQLLALLFTIASLSAWVNKRYIKLPSAIGVMTVSLVFSLAMIALGYLGVLDIAVAHTIIDSINFEALVLHGMLAFLLFAGGLSVNLQDLKSQKIPVALLATVGVFISALITGGLFWLGLRWLGMDIPFIIALLLGAIIAPTDAVAVLGILRKVGAPKSLETKVVGESLFNDGVGVVVFFAVSSIAFGKAVTPLEILRNLTLEVLGGISLGFILGWGVYKILKTVDDYVVEILLTLSLAAGGYALAELLHFSAPICAVVSGLIIGNQGREFAMTEKTREHLDTFWELIDELLNVILFVLVGLEIITLSINPSYVVAGILAIGAVLVGRFVSVAIPISLMRRRQTFSPHVIKVLAWAGLKGGISVALALSLPDSDEHDLLLMCTYVVVLFSVLVQGSTLTHLLRYTQTERTSVTA